MRALVAGLVVLGCAPANSKTAADASTASDDVTRHNAQADTIPTCPPGTMLLPNLDCVPAALACTLNSATPDPTCLPGGLRSAALAAFACPAGWRVDPERGCIPRLNAECPEGSGPLPDGTCTDTTTCPDSTYPEIPPGIDPAHVVHVDDDAPIGGDGSRARPFQDLSEAFHRVPNRGAILVAAGEYPVHAEVRREITVRGVCAPRVRLRSLATSPEADLLLVRGAGVRLTVEGVSAATQSHRLVGADQGASISLRRVSFHSQRVMLALVREGGSADISEVFHRVDDVSPDPRHPIAQVEDASLVLRRSVATNAGANLVRAARSSSIRVEDCAAVGTAGGLYAEGAAALSVDRLAVRGTNRGHGLWVLNTPAEIRDVSIEGTSSRFAFGADVTLSRFSGYRAGIEVYEPETRLRATDVAMTDVRVQTDRLSSCLVAERAARVELQRGRFTRCNDTALYAATGASMTLDNIYLRDARPNAAGFVGIGFTQALGGASTLRRAIIDHAGMAAVVAIHLSPRLAQTLPWDMLTSSPVARALREPSRITLEDVVIQNGEATADMPSAGIFGGAYSEIRGTRVAVLRQSGVGILSGDSGFERQALVESIASGGAQLAALLPPFVDGASSMALQDVFVGPIRRARIIWDNTTRRSQPDFVAAYGAYVSPGCTMSLRNGFFEGNGSTEHALVAQGDVSVQNGVVTGASRCAALRSSIAAGTVTLEGVRMQGNGQDAVCVDDAIPALRIPMSPN